MTIELFEVERMQNSRIVLFFFGASTFTVHLRWFIADVAYLFTRLWTLFNGKRIATEKI